MNKIVQKYNRKKEILMKPKQIYVILIALAVFSEFYSISVSADSVVSNSQDVTTPLRIQRLEDPLERIRRDPAAVVGDFDELQPAGRKAHGDMPSTGVEGVFDQLLERACRPLDDLPCRDSIDQL